jgi:hypothetical protein
MKNSTGTTTQILRGMVLSLLENGIQKQDVVAALDRLTAEARGDDWKKGLETRERARGSAVLNP